MYNLIQKRKANLNNKIGFTLVEVIVVLVILAVLAAILIPSMVGYIKKAEEKALIAECRACVMAAQVLVSENKGMKDRDVDSNDFRKKVSDFAEVPGAISMIGVKEGAKIVFLSYKIEKNEKWVAYRMEYEPKYVITDKDPQLGVK